MLLSCIYEGHSGNTVMIPDLQLETKSGRKYWKTVYKGNLIVDSLKGILRWKYWIWLPNRCIPHGDYKVGRSCTTAPSGLTYLTIYLVLMCFPLITLSMIWITTRCDLSRKAGYRFFHCVKISNVHFTSNTPPQEMCQIAAWWFHQAAAMFSLVFTFDVHIMPPQDSPHNLCVTGWSRSLSRSKIFRGCTFYQDMFGGP